MSEQRRVAHENLDTAWDDLKAYFAAYKRHKSLTDAQVENLKKAWERYKWACASLRFHGITPPHLRESPDSEVIKVLSTLRALNLIDPFPPI